MTAESLAGLSARAYRHMRPWTASDFATALASPLSVLVAEPEGFVLGRVVAGEAEVLALAVDPEAQGQGLASRLLQRFEERAHARGAGEVFLEVGARNGPARGLYATAGYVQVGLRKGYYPLADGGADDALCLKKVLGGPNGGPAAAESSKSG